MVRRERNEQTKFCTKLNPCFRHSNWTIYSNQCCFSSGFVDSRHSVNSHMGCGVILAIPAVIIANNASSIANVQPGHPDSGMAKAAQVSSWVNIILTILGLIAVFFIFVVIGSSLSLLT